MAAASFTTGITRQLYGEQFAVAEKYFGADLVAEIPNHTFTGTEGKYPSVFKDPTRMPADVVKGILPSERPFICFRYVLDKTTRVGTILLRHALSVNMPESDNRWAGASDNTGNDDSIFLKSRLEEADFKILKGILDGANLETTGGRYLPMFAKRFTAES